MQKLNLNNIPEAPENKDFWVVGTANREGSIDSNSYKLNLKSLGGGGIDLNDRAALRALKKALDDAAVIYITDADVDENGVIINTEGFPDATWSLSDIQNQIFRVSGNFKIANDDRVVVVNNIELQNQAPKDATLWKGYVRDIIVSLVANMAAPSSPISWTLELVPQTN